MDKFETELSGNLEEPTTPEYEKEKSNMEQGLEEPESPELEEPTL